MRSGRLECTQNRSVSDLVTTIANPLAPAAGSAIVAAERWLVTDYDAAIGWQTRRAANVAADAAAEIVIMLEHAPVYTMGRRGGRKHLLVGERALSAPLRDSDRGGDITFHGPGQLVVYPILRLRERGLGIVTYMRMLEAVSISTAGAFGVHAERVRGRPGCWVGERKLGAVGVRLRDGVSTHGLALNVCTDLSWFDAITPCGIEGAQMTSISRELGRAVPVDDAAAAMRDVFRDVFGLRLALSPTEASR